jgi:hypothetical protein
MQRRFLSWGISIWFFFLCGCAVDMKIDPQVRQIDNIDFRIKGKIVYEGNKEYLPRVLVDELASNLKLTLQYTYDVIYGKHDVPSAVALFNPLTIAGFPTGENTTTVIGKLDVMKGGEVIKSYKAICILKKTQNLFSEETFTELRRQGLLGVRNNIEIQIYLDRDYLERLLTTE